MKNTAVTIPAATMNALKTEAAALGCTVEELIHDITMNYVSK